MVLELLPTQGGDDGVWDAKVNAAILFLEEMLAAGLANLLEEILEDRDRLNRVDPGAVMAAGRRAVPNGSGGVTLDDAEVVNVREYQITGGSNERAKIQQLVDNIRSGAQRRRVIYWPALPLGQTYQVDDSIKVTEDANVVAGLTCWRGEHRNRSIIELTGEANKPVILYQNDYGTYGTDFADLQIRYARRPTAADTQRYGIQIRADTPGTGVSGGGVYLGIMERMIFDNTYVGVGEYGTGASTMPFWSMQFRDITLFHTLMHAFKFASGGGTTGHPNVKLDNINILNYDQPGMGTGDGVKSLGAAIYASAMSGMVINGLNIEDWWNSHLQITGGSYCVINGLRLERPRVDGTGPGGAFPTLFTLTNANDIVRGVDLGSVQQFATISEIRLFDFYGSDWILEGLSGQRDSALSTVNLMMTAVRSDPNGGGAGSVRGVRGNANLRSHSPTSTLSLGIRTVNDMPPILEQALPTASAYYEGRSIIRLVSNVATLHTCLRTGAGTYAWVQVS